MTYETLVAHLNEVTTIMDEEIRITRGHDIGSAASFVWSLYGRKLIRNGDTDVYDNVHAMFMDKYK